MPSSARAYAILKKRASFLAVAATGKKWVAPGFVLQFGTKRESEAFAIGFTATKRIGSAVQRNRAKRRLRALAREVMAPHAKGGRDYVLVARMETGKSEYNILRRDLETALKRMKAWREATA
jgi:ribonuclease P protein component